MILKKTSLALTILLAFALNACGNASSTSAKNEQTTASATKETHSAREAGDETEIPDDSETAEVEISEEEKALVIDEWKTIRDGLVSFYEINGLCTIEKNGAKMKLKLDGHTFKMLCMLDEWDEYNWTNDEYDSYIQDFFNKLDSIVGNSENYFYETVLAINNVTRGKFWNTKGNLNSTEDCNFKIIDNIWEFSVEENNIGENIEHSSSIIFADSGFTKTTRTTYNGTTYLEECNYPRINVRELDKGKTTITTECTEENLIIEEVELGTLFTKDDRTKLFDNFMKKCKIETEFLY